MISGALSIGLGLVSGLNARLIFLGHLAFVIGACKEYGMVNAWLAIYKPQKLRATVFTIVGFIMIMLGFNVIGLLLEVIGFISLKDFDTLCCL
ncbi:hypothetical protein HDU97_007049 [Phlyctochytrium planicorne]|nr:hypothetical protein HDU97_007049 [Phlyctochytrium planicorne]